MRELPCQISSFELHAFFTFGTSEGTLIEARRSDAHKLGLALHIGILRMRGRLLDALQLHESLENVPPVVLKPRVFKMKPSASELYT